LKQSLKKISRLKGSFLSRKILGRKSTRKTLQTIQETIKMRFSEKALGKECN